jgi:DNA-binding MarR family transcriptional regulator
MAQAPRIDGDIPVIEGKSIPEDILRDSVLAHIAVAYFSVGRRLERKTQCSATRGFILNALRGGVGLNQNQIAKMLGFDRTVVHRSIKTMVEEGLLSERKAPSGKALVTHLTPKGNKYRENLIRIRRAADDKLRQELTQEDRDMLIRLLKRVAETEF